MDTKRPRRNLNDPTPDEWTAASRTHPVGSRGWYQEQEEKPYEGYFKGRSSASFVPADYVDPMHNPPHPGAFIQETYMDPSDCTSRYHLDSEALAILCNVPHGDVLSLLAGTSRVTPQMAVRLSEGLGRTKQSWMAMQKAYDDSNKESEGNPKARVGDLKVPMHLVPPVATVHLAMALEDGAKKYGAFNYRSEQINVSTYIGAIHRHLAAYQDGEDFAADSGVHHIAAVLAGGAILLDCLSMGNLVDDRPVSSNAAKLIAEWRSK
jgi:addiction module HigA family antidote